MSSERNLQTGSYKPANIISEDEKRAKKKKKQSICYLIGSVMALGGIIAISESGSAFISSD